MMPCGSIVVHNNISDEGTRLYAWLIFRPSKCRKHVPPKRRTPLRHFPEYSTFTIIALAAVYVTLTEITKPRKLSVVTMSEGWTTEVQFQATDFSRSSGVHPAFYPTGTGGSRLQWSGMRRAIKYFHAPIRLCGVLLNLE